MKDGWMKNEGWMNEDGRLVAMVEGWRDERVEIGVLEGCPIRRVKELHELEGEDAVAA